MTNTHKIEYTKRQIATAWGCNESTVRARLKKLGIQELPNSKIEFHQANLAYIKKVESDARQKSEIAIDPEAAARKLTAEADIAEAKAREARRREQLADKELLYVKHVEQVWGEALTEIRQRCHEWHQQCMSIGHLKPKQCERQENEFIEFLTKLPV